jgi:hypothetical protein
VTRLSRASLVGATIATLSVFGLVIPLLANQGPATQRLTEDTVVGTTYGEVTLPAGWDLDIAAAASSSPVVSKRDITIGVGDGVWFEGSAGLLENIADLIYDTPASIPPAPDDDGPFSNLSGSFTEEPDEYEPFRQVFRISAGINASSDEPRFVDVVRYGESVIFVVVRGDDEGVARELDTVRAIVDSVTFASAEPGLEPRP